MQIVIEIPEDVYNYMILRCMYQKKDDPGLSYFEKAGIAIKNGTPLPKGHGNLIERNKVFNALHCFYAHDALDIVCNLPVIIEADKEDK